MHVSQNVNYLCPRHSLLSLPSFVSPFAFASLEECKIPHGAKPGLDRQGRLSLGQAHVYHYMNHLMILIASRQYIASIAVMIITGS